MANGIYDWSATTPLTNGTVDPIVNFAEGQYPSTLNNSNRAVMQRLAQYWQDQGYGTVAGTADALTLTPLNTLTSYTSGMVYSFKAASSNTTAATLNVSAVGAKAIRKISGGTDVALVAGDIAAAGRYVVVYDAAANSAAGAWILVTPNLSAYLPLVGGTLTGNLNLTKSTPLLGLNKSASGEASVVAGRLNALTRWQLHLGDTASEAGTNSGSDFRVWRYDDSGTLIDSPLSITRSTGSINANSGQIGFPATQNPSTNANTLDDYEEGTWTPTMTFNNSSTGVTYSLQTATYVKIGQQVWLTGRVTLTNNGTGVGIARIDNLPFPVNAFGAIGSMNTFAGMSAATSIFPSADVSASTMSFFIPGATSSTGATDTNFTNTADFRFSIVYQSTS